MSTTNAQKNDVVKKIITELISHYGLDDVDGLCRMLDVKYATMKGWERRGNIADVKPFLFKCPGINLEWLKTGEGPMFIPAIGEGIYSTPPAKAPTIAEQLHGYSAEIKWLADYMEIKTKGCSSTKRLEIAEEILDLVKKRTGESE